MYSRSGERCPRLRIMPKANKKNKNAARTKLRVGNTVARAQNSNSGIKGVTTNVAVNLHGAFGDNPKPATIRSALDAFSPQHAPLPRAVGDYTVIKTNATITTSSTVVFLGPMSVRSAISSNPQWTNTIAMSSVTSGAAISGAANAYAHSITSLAEASFNKANMCPAAVSFRIMNGEPLQTTTGVIYTGRCSQMLNPGGDARTWTQFADEVLNYTQLRTLSASALAIEPVQMDLVPMNATSFSDFLPRWSVATGAQTWGSNEMVYDGFNTGIIYNPSGASLTILACVEWRMRFDPLNPAYATHTYHGVSSIGFWDRVLAYATDNAAGVTNLATQLGRQAAIAYVRNHQQRRLEL